MIKSRKVKNMLINAFVLFAAIISVITLASCSEETEDTDSILTVTLVNSEGTYTVNIPNTLTNQSYTSESSGNVYEGYSLNDIINNLITEDGTALVSNYDSIGFTCSDDDESIDYSARVYTKEEVEATDTYIYVVNANASTRIYSSLSDTAALLGRNALKKVTAINITGEDACTLTLTWAAEEAELEESGDTTTEITDGRTDGKTAKDNQIESLTVTVVKNDITYTVNIPDTLTVQSYTSSSGSIYYGYTMSDLLSNLKDGDTALVSDYTNVSFTCSTDDVDADYSARIYTKEEIEATENYIYVVASTTSTRIYSSLADSDPETDRNALKKVSVITVNGTDSCTITLTWTLASTDTDTDTQSGTDSGTFA